MKPLLALAAVPIGAAAALLIAAATWWYVTRPHDREYVATRTWARRTSEPTTGTPTRARWVMFTEGEDGVQPFDPRTAATGLYAA